MKKQKTAKRAFISSLISLALCVTMLVGTTFAWYTDSVTSGRNTIVAGSLDMVLERYNGNTTGTAFADNWQNVDGTTKIFNETDGKLTFEPGAVQVAYVRVKNNGDLAFKYSLAAKVFEETAGTNQAGASFLLSDYLKFGTATTDAPYTSREAAINAVKDGATKLQDAQLANGAVIKKDDAPVIVALVIYMPEDVGNDANPQPDKKPTISFGLNALATQATIENDSFSNTYDALSEFPGQAVAGATYDADAETTITAGPATATIPAATDLNVVDNTDLVLTVERVNPSVANITINEGDNAIAYDVSLTDGNGVAVTATTGGIRVVLDIGVVDLQAFYHNAAALTKVDSLDAVALNKYYYDVAAGKLTFITDSFSPFTAVYKFSGGLGTEAHPYLIGTYDDLVNVYNADNTVFKLVEDIDVSAHDGSAWCHSSLEDASQFIKIDLDGHTIKIGSKYLFGYAVNLEMFNGTFEFNGVGSRTSIVDYACYVDEVNAYNINFHDLTLNGKITENGSTHFGALVAYAFGINTELSTYTAENIVNNLVIESIGSNGDVGGLFGYVQGSKAKAVIRNCTFNGSITSVNAGAFLNCCSFPNGGIVNEGNVLNGKLLASKNLRIFGCNGNVTGGNATLAALDQAVTIGPDAQYTKVEPSTDLVSINGNNQIVISAKSGVKYYVAAVMFNVNNVVNSTGGYPRYITETINQFSGDKVTGLYKYAIVDESSDGSAGNTIVSSDGGDPVIWLADGAYHMYSTDYAKSNNKATITVYGYGDGGVIVAYQTIDYTY